MKDLYEQIEQQKLENEENKQKMEQKFFVEKNKMEREVRKTNYSWQNVLTLNLVYIANA